MHHLSLNSGQNDAMDQEAPTIWSAAVGVATEFLGPTSLLLQGRGARAGAGGVKRREKAAQAQQEPVVGHRRRPAGRLPPLLTPSPPRHRCLQAHARIPDDAWEYQVRKALNDAAYNGLDYVPYCSTMPVQPRDDNPKWLWKKKGGKN